MIRTKKHHIINSDTNKTWCTRKIETINFYYGYVESRNKLYCGSCMRRMLDSLQRSLDAIPTRNKHTD